MEYTKNALDIPAIIALLQSRGLAITDTKAAESFLLHVSYFRFAAYMKPLEADHDSHRFKPSATFEQAFALYNFDAELRKLVFDAMQKIEISLRSHIIHYFSLAHGPFWFFDEACAIDKHNYLENMNSIERELQRTKEEFIKEHNKKYGDAGFPPAWKTLEVVSFGCLTKLFINFTDIKTKKKIARAYKLPQHEILESWMKSIIALRNACAHHARIWNRTMPRMPQLPTRLGGKWISAASTQPNRPYAVLSCLAYWLNAIDPANTFAADFKALLARYPSVDPAAMGVARGWENEPLWKAKDEERETKTD